MMSRILKTESGAALLITLGALAIVSILGAAAITVAGGSLNLTEWDKSTHQAFNVAEAGFDQAIARARNGTLDGDFTTTLANGEASVTVTTLTDFIYYIKSVGAHPSLSDPQARRAVEGKVTAISSYNVMFADGAAGVILGSATLDGPLYTRDHLTLNGFGQITGGPLFIKDNPATSDHTGDLELQGNAFVGTAADPIYAFIDGTYPPPNPNFNTIAIYSDVPDINMPVVSDSLEDMNEQRGLADLVIDDDGVTNGSNPLVWDKNAPAVTYGVYPAGPYLKWEIVPGNKRILRIEGIVFVDGAVSLGENRIGQIEYTGKGTIIANGPIAVNSELQPTILSEFPDTSALGLVTGSQIDFSPNKTSDSIYALAYAREQVNFTRQFDFYGCVMTDIMDVRLNPHLHITTDLSEWDLPPGMPEIDASTVVTDWREVAP